jgi:hypothetical protein
MFPPIAAVENPGTEPVADNAEETGSLCCSGLRRRLLRAPAFPGRILSKPQPGWNRARILPPRR